MKFENPMPLSQYVYWFDFYHRIVDNTNMSNTCSVNMDTEYEILDLLDFNSRYKKHWLKILTIYNFSS